eukprot:Trichotokara_eunicae@DN5231_c0_g1_i1.p1
MMQEEDKNILFRQKHLSDLELSKNLVCTPENEDEFIPSLLGKGFLKEVMYMYNSKTHEAATFVIPGQCVASHPNLTHGGFSAAIVDNTFGHLARNIFVMPVTKDLTVSYKKPLLIGVPFIVMVKIVSRTVDAKNRPVMELAATLTTRDEMVAIEARATFVEVGSSATIGG